MTAAYRPFERALLDLFVQVYRYKPSLRIVDMLDLAMMGIISRGSVLCSFFVPYHAVFCIFSTASLCAICFLKLFLMLLLVYTQARTNDLYNLLHFSLLYNLYRVPLL